MDEYIKRREAAYNHFNNAVGQYDVDMAIYEIMSAELAMEKYIKEQKKKEAQM